jgi:murein DD-endopeptidase MepM/ murein hydrolase activator NlpD
MIIASTIVMFKWMTAENNTPIEIVSITDEQQHPQMHVALKLSADESEIEVNDYYAKRLAQLEAEAIRLKAITEQLADMSGIDMQAFEFYKPGQGGIESSGESLSMSEIDAGMDKLMSGFSTQLNQLDQLQEYILTEDNITSAISSGRPVDGGWISSFYGKRLDPFTGKKTFHHGIDIAGKKGSSVFAVADGIVTDASKRNGYGSLVEVDHGNGYVTRYAHNQSLTVALGDVVKKGQEIALMGSTGRSTGPHVHFEVLRDGKSVNPFNFLK